MNRENLYIYRQVNSFVNEIDISKDLDTYRIISYISTPQL